MRGKNKIIFLSAILLISGLMLGGCGQNASEKQNSNLVEKEELKEEAKIESKTNLSKEISAIIEDNSKKTKKLENDNQQKTKDISNKDNQENAMSEKNINMELAKTCERAMLETNMGEIIIKFYGSKAPMTVANFCTLAQKEFYNGVKFHRVIDGFMIQAGDPTSKDDTKKELWGTNGPGYKFQDELPQAGEYKLGSVAMANNARPNTNGSQFFIVSGDSGVSLPPSYSLFGEVVKGMDVVEKIQKVETDTSDRPISAVIIKKVNLELKK